MLGDFTYFQIAFLSGAALLAALVRGFSGFGSALVYMPLAAQSLTPFQALTTIVIFDLLGPLPMVRKASQECEARDLTRLIVGLVVALPIGLYTLTRVPPEVFQYSLSMASMRPVKIIRANTFLFLFATDIVMLPALAMFGRLDASALFLGAILIIPNLIGILVGSRLFRPEYERTYRAVAYTIIAASALSGLPIWG